MSKFVLKPSALSKQAAKLEYYADEQGGAKKAKLDTGAVSAEDKEKNGESSASASIPAFGGAAASAGSVSSFADVVEKSSEKDRLKIGASFFKPDPLAGTSPAAAAARFVFGMNVHDRVLGVAEGGGTDTEKKSGDLSNGSTNLFSGVSGSKPSTQDDAESKTEEAGVSQPLSPSASPTTSGASGPSKSLTDSAAAYERRLAEEKQDKLRLLSNENASTGEEAERNVLQVTCKLYAFNSADRSWAERGRGELHLNDAVVDGDDGDGRPPISRIVIRAQGSLRVALNSRLFPEMTARKVRQKTVEFTATETVPADGGTSEADNNAPAGEHMRIFLVHLPTAHDADNLHQELETRIKALRDYKKE